ncbi:hypothetical protein [Desulfoferrobacter suflitae]|uniref:hypothetical protein n=1 Tax=Desulfoferrobacter suflitae TaxID=2865782 RepID=UPI00216480CA|nr:hypothetical protein [Desulfoferrobacter suflitae]MCK8602472.1 hypothetical protein [Desulfoferrobacter suflitae]
MIELRMGVDKRDLEKAFVFISVYLRLSSWTLPGTDRRRQEADQLWSAGAIHGR